MDGASEPSPEPKEEEDEVKAVTSPCSSENFAKLPNEPSTNAVEEVLASRAGLAGNREKFLQIGIVLLEEFTKPTIQNYFVQVKRQQISRDFKHSLERLLDNKCQICRRSLAGSSILIEK